jgi:hypothetical protein
MFDLNQSNVVLTEAYYQNSPELTEIVTILGEIGTIVKQDPRSNISKTVQNTRLCNAIARLFNCKAVYIQWIRTKNYSNASTYVTWAVDPITNPGEIEARISTVETPNGVKYKNPVNELYITMYNGIYHAVEHNPRIVASVLLHEIGHNFFLEKEYISRFIQPLTIFDRIYRWFWKNGFKKRATGQDTQLTNDEIDDHYAPDVTETSEEIHMAHSIFNSVFGVAAVLKNFSTAVINVLNFAVLGKKSWEVLHYQSEKYADNFATMYGFGEEVVLFDRYYADNNMGSKDKYKEKNSSDNPYTHLYRVTRIMVGYMYTFIDPHPHSYTRMYDQLRYLEQELKNSNHPPELKSRLRNDIARIRNILSEYENEITKNDAYALIKKINKFLFGKAVIDWRELFPIKEDLQMGLDTLDIYENLFENYLSHLGYELNSDPIHDVTKTGQVRVPICEGAFIPYEQFQLGVSYIMPQNCKTLQESILRNIGKGISDMGSKAGKSLSDAGGSVGKYIRMAMGTARKLGDDTVDSTANVADAADSIKDATENIKETVIEANKLADKVDNSVNRAVEYAEKKETQAKEVVDYAKSKIFILGGASIIGTAIGQSVFYNQNMMINAAGEYIKKSRGMMMLAAGIESGDDDVIPETEKNKFKLVLRFVFEGLILVVTATLMSTILAALAMNIWIGVVFAVAMPVVIAWKRTTKDTERMAAQLDNEIEEIEKFMGSKKYRSLSRTQKAAIVKFSQNLVKLRMNI